MRRIIVCILLCYLFQTVQHNDLVFPNEINLGTVDTEVETIITIKNHGDKRRLIYSIVPSCRCVIVDWKNEVLEPQSELLIKIRIDGHKGKEFKENIYIMISGERKAKVINIIGNKNQ